VTRILIVRPQPGAAATAERAAALGLEAIVAPLFEIVPLDWSMPDIAVEAVMLTSANAVRQAGAGLKPLTGLACFVVGEATAAAAASAGFRDVRCAGGTVEMLTAAIEASGVRNVLHLCGRHRTDAPRAKVRVIDVPVYEAKGRSSLSSEAQQALGDGAIALIHSTRAARLLARLAAPFRGRTMIAAISEGAASAAGDGWARIAVAARPTDEALLELAGKLCQSAGQG
jgi:uroporphyrinogen-III synthase